MYVLKFLSVINNYKPLSCVILQRNLNCATIELFKMLLNNSLSAV